MPSSPIGLGPFWIQRMLVVLIGCGYGTLLAGIDGVPLGSYLLQLLVLFAQAVHSLYLGYAKGSLWHRRYAFFWLGYTLVFSVASSCFDFSTLGGIFILVGGGLVLPFILMGLYAFFGHLGYKRALAEGYDEVLDDDFGGHA